MNNAFIHIPISFAAVILSLAITIPAEAQYINVQLDISAEANADVQQPLDFGTLISGSGNTRIEPGSPSMGIFRIRVLQAQQILFHLELPQYLEHTDPEINAQIPVRLYASYSEFGEEDFAMAVPVNSPYEEVVLTTPGSSDHEWATAYLYLYGDIHVGEITDGTYRGEVVLNIEYE